MSQPLQIKAVGMMSSLGFGAEANCAAMRLNYDGLNTSNFEQPSTGKMLLGATIESDSRGANRLAEFAQAAIADALQDQDSTPQSIQPIVCMADGRAQFTSAQTPAKLHAILSKNQPECFTDEWAFMPKGPVGLIRAFERARDLLYQTGIDSVMIIAVDSLLNNTSISHFLAGERIPGCRLLIDKNPDGFIPGEAAAALLISKPTTEHEPQLLCEGLGLGTEPAPLDSGELSRADGMVQAVEHAVQEAGRTVATVNYRMSNVSGEKYFFEEDTLMLYRTCRPVVEDHPVWHIADSVGETGAAAGAIMLCVVYWASIKGYAPGFSCLLCLSSASAARGAMVLNYSVNR